MVNNRLIANKIAIAVKKESEATYNKITSFVDMPDLAGKVDNIDVTCFEDPCKMSRAGIKDFGELSFGFMYEEYDVTTNTSNYKKCKDLADTEEVLDWELTFPDNTKYNFKGACTVGIDGAGVSAAMKFKVTVMLASDITSIFPTTIRKGGKD